MNQIKKFVSKLLKDYFNESDKKELIHLLTVSLEEKVEDLVEQGTPVDKAIEQSIQEFGNAEDVLEAFPKKANMDRRNLINKRKGQFMFSILGYLAIVGICTFFNVIFIDFFVHPWAVLVGIGVSFWPGAMFYHYRLSKK
jgi:hypothetical protein